VLFWLALAWVLGLLFVISARAWPQQAGTPPPSTAQSSSPMQIVQTLKADSTTLVNRLLTRKNELAEQSQHIANLSVALSDSDSQSLALQKRLEISQADNEQLQAELTATSSSLVQSNDSLASLRQHSLDRQAAEAKRIDALSGQLWLWRVLSGLGLAAGILIAIIF